MMVKKVGSNGAVADWRSDYTVGGSKGTEQKC